MASINREKIQAEAQKLAEKKKYSAAVVELKRITDADPNDSRTLQKIGDLQLKQGLFAEAIDTYDAVGRLYANGGFAHKAIAVYKQIREIIATQVPQFEARYAHVAPKLAELYAELGLTSDALTLLNEVAARLQSQQKDRELTDILRRIADIDRQNPLSHIRYAEALSRAKEIEGAVASFKVAASLLVETDRRDDAITVLERLLHHKPDPEQARFCAAQYLARNKPHDATQALTKLQIAFQANPKDIDTLGLIARAFDVVGQNGKSIEVQKEMARIARDTNRPDVFRDLVMVLLRIAPNDPGVRELAQQVGT